ncbi:hypothetical protein [Streptomyces sp. MNU76]|uniref:hypothetical protein n=1 Tax=Streptomyces sp. MNU76 TaxID=2560026 RepID=UPI0027E1254C|nr:hypothetical protein [Streptomyces sp. MNU76]
MSEAGGAVQCVDERQSESTVRREVSGEMILAVGHADLASHTLKLVEAELRAVLDRLPERVPGLVRVGAGCRWRSAGRCGRRVGNSSW